ncbi:MAG: hypothetical protein KIT34_17485 [Cyanobacteria bacterium TGS_CYA1]|nr:hypothetical protein [Cyanobacteria bacterium TGS_CYA1]
MTAGQNPEANANDNVAASSATENENTSVRDKFLADSGLTGPSVQIASMNFAPSTLFQENQGKTINQIATDANNTFSWKADANAIAPGFNPAAALPNLLQNRPAAQWKADFNQVAPVFNPNQVNPVQDRTNPVFNGVRPEVQIQNQGMQEWQLFGSSQTVIANQFPEAKVLQGDGNQVTIQLANLMVRVRKGAGVDMVVAGQQPQSVQQPIVDIPLGNERLRIDVQSGSIARFALTPGGYTMFESIEADGRKIKLENGQPSQVKYPDGRTDTLSQGRLVRTDYGDGKSFEQFDQNGKPVKALKNGVYYEYQNGRPTMVRSEDGKFFQANYDAQGKVQNYVVGKIVGNNQAQVFEQGTRDASGLRISKLNQTTGQLEAVNQAVGDVALSPNGTIQYLDANGFRQEANGVKTKRDSRLINTMVETPDGQMLAQQVQPLRSIVYPNGRSTEYMYLSDTSAKVNGMTPGQNSPDAVFSYARRNAQGQIEEIGVRMPEVPGQPPQWLEFRANRVAGKTAFTNEEVQKVLQISALLVPGDAQQTASNMATLRSMTAMREFLPQSQDEVTVGVQIDQTTGKQIHVYANRDYKVFDENGSEHKFGKDGVISTAADGRKFYYDYQTGNTSYLDGNKLQTVAWDASRDVPGDKQVIMNVANAQKPNMERFGSRYNAQQIEFTYDTAGNVASLKIKQPVVEGNQVKGFKEQTYVRTSGNMWKIQETGEERELSVQRDEKGNVSVSGYKMIDGQKVAVNRTFQADGSEVVGTGAGDQYTPLYQLKAPPPPISHGPVRFPANVPPPDYMMNRARAMYEAQNPDPQMNDGVYRRNAQDQSLRPYQAAPEDEYMPEPYSPEMQPPVYDSRQPIQPQPEMDPNDPNNPNNPNNPRRRQNPNQRRPWRASPFKEGGTDFRRQTVSPDPTVSVTR